MSSSNDLQHKKPALVIIVGVGAVILLVLAVTLRVVGNRNQSSDVSTSKSENKATASKAPAVFTVERVSPADASKLIASKTDDLNFIIVDVRTAEEYAGGHIKGAQNLIDYYAADVSSKIAALDRTKSYLIYCQTGRRSGEIAARMQSMGFHSVYDLNGGIAAWTRGSLPTE